ncbi:MAG: MBOAT family protein [Lachnospiraceae bacterium]|nr:MBOAT family protein [Lachnospiraceae bacterium]
MVFSSAVFLFLFLPGVILLYYLSPKKMRNGVLLLASILFYASGEPRFIFILFVSILINYLFARTMTGRPPTQKRALLLGALIWNLGLIFLFKYLGFFLGILRQLTGFAVNIPAISLPLGISFFTFQAISYVADVYKGDAEAQKNPFTVALYIMLFPQLIAGPIVRYNTIEKEILLKGSRETSLERFGYGTERFLGGLFKKILIANQLSIIADGPLSGAAFSYSPLYLWLAAFCYSLQIYYDFSGYSDMAIGLGEMFGFHFEENFDDPYAAGSITEHWRRWHISLGRFFKDYVYIPLGGSRCGSFKQVRNLFLVWLLTGIWHGASFNYIFWGLAYFVIILLEKFVAKPWERGKGFRFFWRVFTLLFINLNFVVFHVPGLRRAGAYLGAMFGAGGYSGELLSGEVIVAFREGWFFLLAGILFCIPASKKLKKIPIAPAFYCVLFIWTLSFLILGGHNPFIYFNF